MFLKVDFCSVQKMNALTAEKKVDSWDKDDNTHLEFVTAASNLRASIFNIPTSSKFTVKCLYELYCNLISIAEAGNIIPAIATTNAIIAGLIVIEAFKILSAQKNKKFYNVCTLSQ